ncbi:MAG: MBL fold metallo-hydrolase [Candidatus Micrarchaeota archaeon]
MKKIIFIFVVAILLFGCFDGETPANQTIVNNNQTQQNNTPITIVIGGQTNQTIGANITIEPPDNNTIYTEELEYTYQPDQSFGVYFIDVGSDTHGNAVFVKKGDLDILIDAGPEAMGNKVVDFLRSKGVDDLELIISTSADPRQYGGIPTILNNFVVEQYWWGDDSFGDPNYDAILDSMIDKTKSVKIIKAGMSVDLNGMNFTFINPQTDKFNNINNDAVVTRIIDRNFSLLLTSGIQKGAQGKLITKYGQLIKTKILQAPYYGVGEGTSDIGVFLVNANPTNIIITGSSDDSATNGGSREPFKKLLTQYNMKWNDTYTDGTIRIFSDGYEYSISALGSGQ